MNIVSVFDGMACGYLAMLQSGVKVDRYVSFEIDKFASKTSKHNFPDMEQHGDVFEADFTQYEGFDFLVGGSPCTHWSIAQTKNRETTASGIGWDLFCQYVRALCEIKPKYFIYENNKSMSKEIRKSISDTFGFEPICINSALVSAQNRQRLYWCGIRCSDGTYRKAHIEQPEDLGILLKDILEWGGYSMRDKSRTIISSIGRTTPREYFMKQQSEMAAQPLTDKEMEYMVRDTGAFRGGNWNFLNASGNAKSSCIVANFYKGVPYNVCAEEVKPLSAAEMDYMVREVRGGRNHFDFGYTFDPTKDKSPCVTTGANRVPYCVVAEPVCVNSQIDGVQPSLQDRIFSVGGKMVAVTSSNFRPNVAEPVCIAQRGRNPENPKSREKGLPLEQMFEAREDYKSNTLTTVQKDNLVAEPTDGTPKQVQIYEVKNGQITVKGKQYPIKLKDWFYIIRKLTVRECMRLQTVPEWYEFPVSNSQAYKMLGNGWTISVISHLINSILSDNGSYEKAEQMTIFDFIGGE